MNCFRSRFRIDVLLLLTLGISNGPIVFSAEFIQIGGADSDVFDVTSDGQSVAGVDSAGAWTWTRDAGISYLPDGDDFVLQELSGDGAVAVGSRRISGDTTAYAYDSGSYFRLSGSEDFELSHARDASFDGRAIVGIAHRDGVDIGFRWTEETELELLGTLPTSTRSSAVAVSADGNVVVGQSSTGEGWLNTVDRRGQAYYWTQETGIIGIGFLQSATFSWARSVSGDGSTIIGSSGTQDYKEAYRWTQSGGMQSLGYLPGHGQSEAWDVTFDGAVVVGESATPTFSSTRAYVWDTDNGMQDLKQVLEQQHGLEISGALDSWVLISDDQLTLAGVSRTPERSWVALLDKPLVRPLGDLTGDHFRNAEDIDLLSKAVRDGDQNEEFDLNADGALDGADRDCWVANAVKTFYGDSNLDQNVDFADFLLLSQRFGQEGGWSDGDFTGDGQVRFDDFLSLSSNYGRTLSASSSPATVPEPAGAVLACLALLATFQGRQRRTRTQRAAESWSGR